FSQTQDGHYAKVSPSYDFYVQGEGRAAIGDGFILRAYLTSRYLGGGTMPETVCSDALGAVDGTA
ncbi:hypothetical protein, partial [Bilophila wadsworthia]|uniref:hypothetical protein n=1 Tax=Bilophila wadsworthia TaxID=35833 RepID=UPI003AB42C33